MQFRKLLRREEKRTTFRKETTIEEKGCVRSNLIDGRSAILPPAYEIWVSKDIPSHGKWTRNVQGVDGNLPSKILFHLDELDSLAIRDDKRRFSSYRYLGGS